MKEIFNGYYEIVNLWTKIKKKIENAIEKYDLILDRYKNSNTHIDKYQNLKSKLDLVLFFLHYKYFGRNQHKNI